MKTTHILFAALLSLAGTALRAETLTADFNDGLPEGWSITGDLENNSDRARSGKGIWTSSKSDTLNYLVTEALEGDITFYARAYNKNTNAYVIVYAYDGNIGDQLYTTGNMKTSSSPQFTAYTADLGSYKGQVAIALNYAAIDDVTYTQMEVVEGPALVVKDGSKVTSPYTYDFGLALPGAEKTLALSNPGTEDIDISVEATNGFGATISSSTIAAGTEETLTITMADASATGTVTISTTAEGIEPFVVNVSGTVRDPNKVFVDFADGQLPSDWETTSSSTYYSWTVGEGLISYNGTSSSYSGTLTSPKLTFAKGETVAFETTRYGSSTWYTSSIAIEYSLDGEEWTTIATYTDDAYGVWTSRTVTIPVDDVRFIRYKGWYVSLTNLYGGEIPEEPNMKFNAEDYAFGMVGEATTSTPFTIRNTGRGELTGLSVSSSNTNFAVEIKGDATSIAAESETTFTVTLNAEAKGLQNGTITVAAEGFEAVSFNVSGYVLDTEAIVVDFAGNTVPEGWTNDGFTVANDELSTTYNTRTLTSPAITVAEGQTMVVYAKGGSTWGASLTVKTSTDNGNTWTTAKEFTSELRASTSDYVVLVVDNIEAGNYRLRLEGYYVTINTINGYNYDMNAPEMTVVPAEDFAAGKVTESVSKTYTVSNTGTGELVVNIASDDESFTAEPSQLTITDEPQTFTVTFNYTDGVYGKFSSNITVTPTYDETAAITIVATAQVKDPNSWEEDFEDGTLPTGWVANNWTVGTFSYYENTTPMALAPASSSAGTLVTPLLAANEGDVLTWDAYFNWSDEAMTVEYSSDGQETWTVIYDNYKPEDEEISTRYSHKAMSFTAPADGEYHLRFTSTYQNGVDNFAGFRLVVKEHDMSIAETAIPSNGSQYVLYTATVTLKELAGKEEEVTATLLVNEEEVATATETVDANGTKVLSLAFTPEEALTEAEAKIVITYAGGTLETAATALTIAAAPTLDEEDGSLDDFENWANYDVVAMKYTLRAGWNTIVLPFAVSDLSVFGEGAEAFKLNSYEEGTLHFSRVSELDAQTPYVIYATEAKSELLFTDVKNFRTAASADDLYAKISGEGITFQGTYAPVEAPDMEGKYGINPTTGQVVKGSKYASIKGFRAYIELSEETTGEIKAYAFDGGEATGIAEVSLNEAEGKLIFNVAGQRIAKVQNGINIINGKKILK